MSRLIEVKPNEVIHEVWSGDKIKLLPGSHLPLNFKVEDVEVYGVDGPESTTIDGHRNAEFGIRINDGSKNPYLHDFSITNCGHGTRITTSIGVRIENVISHNNGVEGFHISDCPGAQVRHIKAYDNGKWQFQSYTPDQGHGIYFSYNCSGLTLEDAELIDNMGSGIQCNASSKPTTMKGIVAQRLILTNNGAGGGGTPQISLMGVIDSDFGLIYFSESPNGLVTLFSDGKGERYACRNVKFTNFTVVGEPEWTFRNLEGSQGTVWNPGIGWKPEGNGNGGVVIIKPTPTTGTLEQRVTELEKWRKAVDDNLT